MRRFALLILLACLLFTALPVEAAPPMLPQKIIDLAHVCGQYSPSVIVYTYGTLRIEVPPFKMADEKLPFTVYHRGELVAYRNPNETVLMGGEYRAIINRQHRKLPTCPDDPFTYRCPQELVALLPRGMVYF